MRARAGTTFGLSTVANTAFSSVRSARATLNVVWARAADATATARATIARRRLCMPFRPPKLSRPFRSARRGGLRRPTLGERPTRGGGLAIDLEQRLQPAPRRRARDRVPDGLSVAACLHQSVPAQQRQMLRHRRIAQAQKGGKVAHRTVA